jgi:hypothetical protein
MNIICGPINDQRTVTIELSPKKETLGVFVSGGIDSAILYYLLLKENIALNNLHDIIPFTIFRKEGSSYAAAPVIEHVHFSLGLPLKSALKVGDNTLPEHQQVGSGMQEAYKAGISRVYGGLIQQLPQHLIGWDAVKFRESEKFKAPFQHLNKSHIIDLVRKFDQECLYHITHSCCYDVGRCNVCNGCNERAWGFEQLGIIDPGTY